MGISFPDRCAHCIRDESSLFGSEAPGSARCFGAWPLFVISLFARWQHTAGRRSVASMVAVDIHHSSDHTNGRNLASAYRSALSIPIIKSNSFLFTTFIHAKLGILPPKRCLRCATDGSA